MRRSVLGIFGFLSLSHSAAHAQSSVVRGQVVLQGDGQPLPYTTVVLLPQGTQRLTTDSGTFALSDLPPGEVRLRFKRIGFAPKDTLVVLAPGATLRIQVAMTPLATARTNRMPSDSRHIADYTHWTRFIEVVPGIPVMFEWESRNVFRNGSPPFVQTGKVFDIRWTDSTRAKIDTR